MRSLNLFVLLFVCPLMMFGQLYVQRNGNTYTTGSIIFDNSSSFLGTSSYSVPVVFKVNGVLAGNTGGGDNNVSFGIGASGNQIESKQLVIN